jgi:hypothetical protein
MSTRWQCAVCESVNDGGDTCSVCGATVVQTTTRATPVPQTPAREARTQEERETDVPVRELPVREAPSETSSSDGYDLYDYFTVEDRPSADDSYARSEPFEARPRVRVYGCCLPISLGMLLAFVAAATVLVNLVDDADILVPLLTDAAVRLTTGTTRLCRMRGGTPG